jgi:hypothetical protein
MEQLWLDATLSLLRTMWLSLLTSNVHPSTVHKWSKTRWTSNTSVPVLPSIKTKMGHQQKLVNTTVIKMRINRQQGTMSSVLIVETLSQPTTSTSIDIVVNVTMQALSTKTVLS